LPDYALFLGCMIPVRLPYMESSARELGRKAGIRRGDIVKERYSSLLL